MEDNAPWELYYWPSLPGRGEFVRLVFEDRKVPYVDVARTAPPQQFHRTLQSLTNPATPTHLFPPIKAQPCIKKGNFVLFQSTNICLFLAKKYGLCPPGEMQYIANELALCVTDLLDEVHNVHHPISGTLYYEDQRKEAIQAAGLFLKTRLPAWLAYFEKVLRLNEDSKQEYLVGSECSYVDLMVFQVLCGLEYSYRTFWKGCLGRYPLLWGLKERIGERESLRDYLKSTRRIPFSDTGIFRFYPELDLEGEWQ